MNKQYREAWSLLSGCSNPNTAVSYNQVLCLIQAEEYPQALLKADETLRSLQTLFSPPTIKESETEKRLRAKQNRQDTHLIPITQEYAEAFSAILRESILRLKVDCYRAIGNWSKVIETASQLTCKEYQNVEAALKEADNKLK